MSGHPDPQDDIVRFPLSWEMLSVLKSIIVCFLSVGLSHSLDLILPFETSLIILPLHDYL